MGVEGIRFCPVFLPFFLYFFMIVTHFLSSCSIKNACFYYSEKNRQNLFLFVFFYFVFSNFTKEIKKSYKKIALFIGRNLRGTTYFYLNEKASNVVTAVTATCLLEYSARATQRRVQKHPYTFSPTMCSLKLQSFYYFLFKCCHI